MKLKTIQLAYNGLQPREKYFISVGALLLIVALLYLVLTPLVDRHNELENQRDQLQADINWLQKQAPVLPRLVNSCSGRALDSGSDKDTITTVVRRSQLRLVNISEDAEVISLRFNGTNANRITRLAHQIGCEGFLVQSFEVSAAADQAAYQGVMEVQRVN